MKTFAALSVLLGLATVLPAQIPAGWKTLRDEKGVCQMSVPADWKPNPAIGAMATTPDESDALVSSNEGHKVEPLLEAVQKILGIDKMIENSNQRVFWAGKPASMFKGPVLTGYHVTVPGKGGTCDALITVKEGVSVDLVKKIAGTLGVKK